LRDLLNLGRSQRIVNSSDSLFIHSPSRAGLRVTGNRHMTLCCEKFTPRRAKFFD